MITAVLLAAVVVINRHRAPEDGCASGRCVVVEDDDGHRALGVRDHGHLTANGYHPVCQIVVRRPGASEQAAFEALTIPSSDGIIIVDGAVAKVRRCSLQDSGPRAVLELNPAAYAWAIPDQGDVFIPFDHNPAAWLDDGAHARAVIEQDASGSSEEGRYCVVSGASGDPGEVRCGLHVGDNFDWGSRRARIVRIIAPISPFAGWIEVALQ
jgi:hypothetical protein